MAVPSGYTWNGAGAYLNVADGSGPYTFDGTNMILQGSGSGGGGDASAANQTIEINKLTSIDGKLPALSSGGAIPVTLTFPTTQAVTGAFYQATQPVSGTFWQTTQPVSATALPLPAGAATLAAQTSQQTTLASIDGKTLPAPTAGATTSVTSVTSVTTLLASNTNRKGATITNDSTSVLYLLLGTGVVSGSVYTVILPGNGGVQANSSYYEVPHRFTGVITGIWSVVNGAARITELT